MRALAASVEDGATVIMVTHKLAEILDATKRVVVILDGRIAADEQTERSTARPWCACSFPMRPANGSWRASPLVRSW